MEYERVEGGAAVVIALVGKTKVLLVRSRNHPDPKWKLIAETVKPGESILNTVKYGLEEEAGLENIKTELGLDGKIARFIDPRILKVVRFGEPELMVKAKFKHWRHFFGVLTTDEVIHQLSQADRFTEESDGRGGFEVEALETMEFPLSGLSDMVGLLRPHAELIRSIPQRTTTEVGT